VSKSPDPTPADTWKVCAALEYDMRFDGKPRIEATLGPAEVHCAPGQPEYATVSRKIWVDTCTRCLDNELRAARLQQQVDDLHLQIEARDVVADYKDAEHEELQEQRDWWRRYALIAVAVATVAATMAVALSAKNAGWM